MTLKSYAIFKEILTGGLKNYMRNLVNVHVSSCKPENMHFDGLVSASHLPPSQAEQLPKLSSPPLSANPSFLRISHLPD